MIETIIGALQSTVTFYLIAVWIAVIVVYFVRISIKGKLKTQGFSKKSRFKALNEMVLFYDEMKARIAVLDSQNKVVIFNSGNVEFVKVLVNGELAQNENTAESLHTVVLEFKIPESERLFQIEFLHCLGKEVELNQKRNQQKLAAAFEWKSKIEDPKRIQAG